MKKITSPAFEVGDKARYTAYFLRCTGQFTDSDGTHGWADVVEIGKGHSGRKMITLRWPGGFERKVLDVNLQRQSDTLRTGIDVDPA